MTKTNQKCFLRNTHKATILSPLGTTLKNRDARKSFTIETRNQFKPLENVIEEQSNNSELNMPHETNNPRNDPTMTAENSVEKLPSRTDPADNNFVSSNVDICINNIRRSEKKNAKKTSQQSQQITKRLLIVGDSIVKNIEPYKMKKVQNTLQR